MNVKPHAKPWLWLVPLLILLAALALPRLDQDGLWYDEIWSLRNAGGAHYGPLSPAGIWEQVAFNDPHQAFGYPYLLAAWGSVAGWSEYAGRLLSLFAALLAVALTYRLASLPPLTPPASQGEDTQRSFPLRSGGTGGGSALRSDATRGGSALRSDATRGGSALRSDATRGKSTLRSDATRGRSALRSDATRGGSALPHAENKLFAALMLATSAFFLYYTHELRAFTLVALAATGLLLAYVRLLQRNRLRVGDAALFVLSGAGLLYAHYFAAATLLGALGLFHLLFARKNRRWWQLIGLALLVGLLFLPELPAFLRGFERFSPEDVNQVPLTAGEALWSFAHYLGNGAVPLVALLLLLGALQAWRSGGGLRIVVAISALAVLLTLAANAVLGILEPQRLRYTIVLWPGLALWAGSGFALLAEWLQRTMQHGWLRRTVLLALPGLWLLNALLVYADTSFTEPLHGDRVVRWRTMTNVLQERGGVGDLFAFYAGTGTQAYPITISFEHSTETLPFPAMITSTYFDAASPANQAWARNLLDEAQRVWYGVDRDLGLNEIHSQFEAVLRADWIHCGNFSDDPALPLDLYARSPIFCPDQAPAAAQYANGLRLQDFAGAYRHEPDAGIYSLDLYWTIPPQMPPETYNFTVHITRPGEQTPLVQVDRPLPTTKHAAMRLRAEIAGLPPGTYEAALIVYAWRDGTRLPGAADGTTLERLPLGQFTIP